MRIWVDAQISPAIARWITEHFDEVEAVPVRSPRLRDAEDAEIFEAARRADAAVMTKDSDFVQLSISGRSIHFNRMSLRVCVKPSPVIW